MSGENDNASREDIHSKAVRAGKRTYFFDVKSTRGNDLYLTITESKRHYNDDGKFSYEKHKLFLYKEDFDKFHDGLKESIQKIEELRSETNGRFSANDEASIEENQTISTKPVVEIPSGPSKNGVADINSEAEKFTDVSFEDLENEPNEGANSPADQTE